MSRSRTSAQRITQAERMTQVVTLRKAGFSYRQIGAQLRIGNATVKRDLDKALMEYGAITDEEVRRWRELENARIEQALSAIWRAVVAGNVGAIDRLVKLQDRRAKLLGLDAPSKLAPTTPDGTKPYDPYDALSDDERLARVMEYLERDEKARVLQAGDEPEA